MIESNVQKLRIVDGTKIAFVGTESYFKGFHTASMASTAKENEADMVLLLAEGSTEADITDNDIRALLTNLSGELAKGKPEPF